MKRNLEKTLFDIFALTITTLFAALCILPILLTISGSLTPERELLLGLKLIPNEWSFDAYRMIFRNSAALVRAYGVTIRLILIGVPIGLFLTSLTAYVLYRKDFKARNIITFYFFFTTLFGGGLVAHYVLCSALGLRNTETVLWIQGILPVMNMVVMRTYFTSNIPQSLVESAKIDGANDFRIYWNIVLPASGPILATIGLLKTLTLWNSWSTAAIYISDAKKYPLQYYLQQIFQEANLAAQAAEAGMDFGDRELPGESFKLAMTVFTMGPVVLFYPFIQRFFVSGITVGAVKG